MRKKQTNISLTTETALTVSIVIMLSSLFFLPSLTSMPALAQGAGTILISVSSTLPAISTQNASYSLEGAQLSIYSDEACTQLEAQVQTDALGHAITQALPPGKHYVRLANAPAGFSTDTDTLDVSVEDDAQVKLQYPLKPKYAQPDLLIFETNAETGSRSPVAGSTFSKARFNVSYFDRVTDSATLNGAVRSWTFEADDAGEVHLSDEYRRAGAPLFTGDDNKPVLPCGRYIVTVDTLPHGYRCEDIPIQFDVTADISDINQEEIAFEAIEAKMQVVRGDVTFCKVDDNQNAMAGIPFLLSYSNGEAENQKESHVVITDAEGNYSSESTRVAHSQDTNVNDAAVTINPDGSFTVDESRLSVESGVWFSSDCAGNNAPPDDSRCALPFGSYILQELPCAANADKNLVTVEFSIYADGFPVKLDTIVNTTPTLNGSVSDRLDGDKLLRPNTNASIVDTVSYRNLIPGQAYTLYSTVVCKDTGEHIASASFDESGIQTPIIPEQSSGSVQVELAFDASGLAGKELLIHEEIRSETGMTIEAPEENDAERTIKVQPHIAASAFDTKDQDNYVMGADGSITARISYEGLELGHAYRLSSTLMDRATGNAVRDAQGNVVSVKTEHTPSSYSDSIDMEIPVDVNSLAGHDLVVFTNIQREDEQMVASLQDMDDSDLTVKTVKLTTSACDASDNDKLFDGNADNVKIIDTVKYANLEPGRAYTLSGVLMDKETGKELIVDGKKVVSNKKFTAEAISDSVDMEFAFDASAQTSEILVVFETLTCEDKIVAEHNDIEDVAQTVTCTEIDPERPIETIPGSNDTQKGSTTIGKVTPKTSDEFSRASAVAAMLIIAVCASIAYASHRRARTIESLRKEK